MANCKACGRPAQAALVVHLDCLEDIAAEICDHYCKWPWVCQSEERLHETHCSSCPLNKLLEEGGAKS